MRNELRQGRGLVDGASVRPRTRRRHASFSGVTKAYRRYRWIYSPCFLSRTCDTAVHVGLPALLRALAGADSVVRGVVAPIAARLERTSPRYGWRADRARDEV